jgi:ketosteroid isomerase-like protein
VVGCIYERGCSGHDLTWMENPMVQNGGATKVDGPMVGALDPKSVVLRYYALMNERKYDSAFELLSDDLEWWLLGYEPVDGHQVNGTVNKAEFTQAMRQVMNLTVDGITFEPGMMLVDGNKLALTLESRAELKNGRTYHNHVGKFLEVRDGKIAWVREYPDTKHVHDVLLAP